MKLVNLKMSPEEKKEQASTSLGETQEYPYGLQICLCDDAISQVFSKLPDVGSTHLMCVSVTVTAISQYESAGKDAEKSMQLQITDMGEMPALSKKDQAESLYGKKS